LAVLAEPHMKVHVLLAALSVAAGLALGLSLCEWLAIVTCMGLVFCAEMLNTVIEDLAVAVSPEYSPRVKRLKDMAAGAVLAASFAALVVAFLIYPEKIMRWIVTLPLPGILNEAVERLVVLVWGG